MALKHSYTLLAPIYDSIVSGPLDFYRQKSISQLGDTTNKKILVNGIGSGLDIPYLPTDAQYTGTDITPAMLKRAKQRAEKQKFEIELLIADSQALPFEDETFDIVLMHLILAVVPQPTLALQEASRVLKQNGKILIFDKFLRPNQLALGRRILNFFIRHIATQTSVVFETPLNATPQLSIVHDEPALANGWFRLIELKKQL